MNFLDEVAKECREFYYGDKYRYNTYTNDIIKGAEKSAKALIVANRTWIKSYSDWSKLPKDKQKVISDLTDYNHIAFYERMKILKAKEDILLNEQSIKIKAPIVTEEGWF